MVPLLTIGGRIAPRRL